ncbi:MAG: DUF11 domain-containing protein, partial [Bacteroidetes bacterium]|nr:DUF11 domain-containing protein [Bacteroidota bacterium]
MKKIFLLIAFSLIITGVVLPQTTTISIPDITAEANTDVSIPINVENFNNVGAINLVINYDPNVLTFQTVQDPLNGAWIINSLTGQIRIAWFSLTPLNVNDGPLFHMEFNYIGGNSNIEFDPTSNQIADAVAVVISTTFTNGSIAQIGVTPTGSIGNFVWEDANKNGVQENNETGIKDVIVKLLDAANNDTELKSTTTDTQGKYSFANLSAGSYKVSFTLPTDYNFSLKNANNSTNDTDSDVDPSTGKTDAFTLNAGDNITNIDAGMYKQTTQTSTGSIGDYVWDDLDKDGIQQNKTIEPPLENVTVKLLDATNNDAELKTTTTNADGEYLFTGLSAGTYKVKFVMLNGYVFSPKKVDYPNSQNGDSDADPTTGLTDEITLAENQNVYSVDAGMYKSTTPTPTGSIGDYVWDDLDKNGIQKVKTEEPPLENVIVKLLDASNNELKKTTTDAEGEYLFTGLSAGTYKVKFELLNGYVFSPKKVDYPTSQDGDSDADPTTGLTDEITLTENQNLYGIDAGMYYSPVVVQTPEPWVDVNDYKTVSPDSGLTTTYTINFGNNGNTDLLNATIIDTIPQGYSYVSSSGGISSAETSNGSNIVIFQIGTVAANSADSVKLTVRVTNLESDYLMKACLLGNDGNSNNYQVCASDLNLYDGTSGGGDAGVESRGDLASILLKRQLLIKYGRTTPILAKSDANAITSQHSLSEFYPATGPFNSTATITTPFDILGISNAVSSYAMDYNINIVTGQRRVAGIFSTITEAPYIYDHTKALCDRLGGAVIGDLRLLEINSYKFYAAKIRNERKNQTDYAISFSVYETSSGYQLQSKWTYGEYISPDGASSIYNFQVWSSTYEGTVELVKNILSKFSSFGSLTYLNVNQVEPDVYIKSSYYSHDGTIHLRVMNLGNASQISIVNKYRIAQSDVQVEKNENFAVQKGENDIVLSTGIISDANLSLTSSTGFIDEAFVSGGSYTDISGPNSTILSFSTANYPQPVPSNYTDGSLLLSGGVSISGILSDWISVIRSFSASGDNIDLSNYSNIKFKAKGTGVLTFIFDLTNTQNFNYFSYSVNLTTAETEYSINFSDLVEITPSQNQFDPSLVRNIGFILNKANNLNLTNFNFEVSNIVFSNNLVTGIE